jgi:hypothetical protein
MGGRFATCHALRKIALPRRHDRHLDWTCDDSQYALGRADVLLAENAEYIALSDRPESRQERWREFLLGTDARDPVVRHADWAIGDESFRLRAAQELGRPARAGVVVRASPPGSRCIFQSKLSE